MQKGNIGVTTENIFPIIKKFLYSDHEIFLRELVSNAVDATQKLNTLASIGEFKGELGDLTVHVELGKDTITISDRGIGLTAEEIEKYINQIAFSGANDFLEKYRTMQMPLSDISDLASTLPLWLQRKWRLSLNHTETMQKP